MDAAGDLHIVQRGGATSTANMAQLSARIVSEVGRGLVTLGSDLRTEIVAHVAREVLRLGGAQAWSRTAFYGEGAVVSCYVGRTYELRSACAPRWRRNPATTPRSGGASARTACA